MQSDSLNEVMAMIKRFNDDTYRLKHDDEPYDNPSASTQFFSQLDAPFIQINGMRSDQIVGVGRNLAQHRISNAVEIPDFPYSSELARIDNSMYSEAADLDGLFNYRTHMLPTDMNQGMFQHIMSEWNAPIIAKGYDAMLPTIGVSYNSNQLDVLKQANNLDKASHQNPEDVNSKLLDYVRANFPGHKFDDRTVYVGNIGDENAQLTKLDFTAMMHDHINPHGFSDMPQEFQIPSIISHGISQANADAYLDEHRRTGRSLADIQLSDKEIYRYEKERLSK